jgi:hypothetical protein
MPPAGARAKQPVGSAAWFSAEKENISHLVDQEMEEVEYPIGHEVAWLNEHMAEVFSKNKLSVAPASPPRALRTDCSKRLYRGIQDSGEAPREDTSNGTEAECRRISSGMFQVTRFTSWPLD